MKQTRLTTLTLLLALFLPVLLHPHHHDEGFQVRLPQFSEPPKIDGRLENSLWEKGLVIQSFTQYEPLENSAPSEKTVAYLGYDEKFLYIAFRCYDSNPKAIRACLTKRDKVRGDDEITVYLDTFNDKKRAFVFQVNPCGVQSDGIYSDTRRRGRWGGPRNVDLSWDTYFLSNAQMTDIGYTVEMAIPFKSLRFPNTETQVWGFQMQRNIRRKNEEIYWHPRSRDVNGFLLQAGTIEIQGPLEHGKNLEIMPVLTGSKQNEDKILPQLGANLKYGITSDLTADLAVNPDFSQIEADIPQVDVNQRYALYYPEKRPFFLEGKDIFDTPFELVYTRTIVDPDLGIKLTGKVGKTSLGFLSAYDTNTPKIEIFSSDEDEEDAEEDLPPLKGLVNVFRLKQDIFPESHIGFIITDKESGDSWNSITRDFNRVVGVDGHFKFNNYYTFTFQVLGSQSRADGVKTSLVPATNFSLSRNSRHWRISARYTTLPEDFEASTGFFRRKDIRSFRSRISYAILPQKEWLVDIRPSIEYMRITDFDSILTDEQVELNCFLSGWRGTHIWGGYSAELERYEGIDFHKQSFRISMGSEPLAWLSGNISFRFGDGIYYDDDPYLGFKTSKSLRLTLRPLTNLNIFYNLENDTFFENKGGRKVYTVNIISQRIQLQISRTLSIRLITDYNDYYKELYNSVLFSFEYHPGTVFYIGMEDNRERDDLGMFQREGRYYFIKFSYWWRI